MKNLISLLSLVLMTNGSSVWAAPMPLPKLNDRPLVRAIRMGDYLKSLESYQTVEKADSQNKGKPDIFLVYSKKDGGGRSLLMQLFDLNRDGRIDLVKFYDRDRLARAEADLDFDGKVDLITEYDFVTGEVRRKSQSDGHTNIWTYLSKGKVSRKEIDRNSDGKPDLWVYYKDGKTIKTEIDKNFDGRVVKLEDGKL